MKPHRFLIPLLNWLGAHCGRLAERLEEWQRKLEHCPCCGENRYYGRWCWEARGFPSWEAWRATLPPFKK